MDINNFIQLIIAVIMLISVILVCITLRNNRNLNQNLLFNKIVKQERELIFEYDKIGR